MSNIIIGENGNWYIDGEDTGRPSRGRDGKSAFEIAADLGYQGTMTEWTDDLKGDSAYEIAVNSGFHGTEKEWLGTLKGQKGDAGLTPHIGKNGNWFIGETDTGILANAAQDTQEKLSKVSADLNNLRKFSTNETAIGIWIDGRTIYRKCFNIGQLANASSTTWPHNIANFDRVLHLYGTARDTTLSSGFTITLPFVSMSELTKQINLGVNNTNIILYHTTGNNKYSAIVIMEYVKKS